MFLSKRPNGIYYLFVFDPILNKRTCISTKSKLKSKALEFLVNYKNGIAAKHPAHITLSNAHSLLTQYVIDNLAPSSVLIFHKSFKHLKNILGDRRLDFISINEVEAFKSERLKAVKKTTVNIELRTLKSMFNVLKRRGYLQSNPFNHVKQLKIEEKEILCFQDNEIKTLLNAIKEPVFKNIVLFAFYSGCRISEITNLQWNDIDFQQQVINIRNKENFRTKSGKNRQIPLTNSLLQILNPLKDTQNNVVQIYNTTGYVFISGKFKTKYSRLTITEKFKEYIRELDLPEKYHFHCLRHTAISNWVKAGVNINYIKQLAGHSDIKTTEKYIHIRLDDLKSSLNNINLTLLNN